MFLVPDDVFVSNFYAHMKPSFIRLLLSDVQYKAQLNYPDKTEQYV